MNPAIFLIIWMMFLGACITTWHVRCVLKLKKEQREDAKKVGKNVMSKYPAS
jgi:hypothetical protein